MKENLTHKEAHDRYKDKQVTITVTGEQANIIADCLDMAARFSMGQFRSNYLPSHISDLLHDDPKENPKTWLYRREQWDMLEDIMKSIMHPDLGQNQYFAFSKNEFTRHCCSIHKRIKVASKSWKDQFIEEPSWNTESSFTDIYDVPVAEVKIQD